MWLRWFIEFTDCLYITAHEPRVVQLVSHPFLGNDVLRAGPAQFGLNLKSHQGVGIVTLRNNVVLLII